MREYVISTGGATVSGTTTLIFVRAPASPACNIEFLRHWVGQSANATSAQQRVQLALNSGTVTGTAITPVKKKEVDAVSAITGSTSPLAGQTTINVTTETTRTVQYEDAFNVLNGFLLIHTPAETVIQPAGATSGHTLYLPVAPSTLTNWTWGEIYREV